MLLKTRHGMGILVSSSVRSFQWLGIQKVDVEVGG